MTSTVREVHQNHQEIVRSKWDPTVQNKRFQSAKPTRVAKNPESECNGLFFLPIDFEIYCTLFFASSMCSNTHLTWRVLREHIHSFIAQNNTNNK